MRAGAGCSTAAALLIGTSWIASAAEIRIPKPEGWRTREHLVAVRGERYAVALYNPRSSKQGSILIQGHGEETVRTELQGTIMHMELAATGRHVALMRTVRDPRGRGLGAVMELLDGGGTVRQVAGSGAASRFSTSGQVLYRPIEDEDGLFRSVAIFDLTGEPVETLELGRPFSDVLVIGNGKQLVVLRSPSSAGCSRTESSRSVRWRSRCRGRPRWKGWSSPWVVAWRGWTTASPRCSRTCCPSGRRIGRSQLLRHVGFSSRTSSIA